MGWEKKETAPPRRAEPHTQVLFCASRLSYGLAMCGKASRDVCDLRCFAAIGEMICFATLRLALNLLNTALVRVLPGFD